MVTPGSRATGESWEAGSDKRHAGAQPGRRRFLHWASASAVFFAAHGFFAPDGSTSEAAGGAGRETGPRLLSLELLSSAPLQQLKQFYEQTLGLRLLEERPDRLTIAAGASRLTFLPAGTGDAAPWYHFAFNIPENKVVAALQW